MTITFSAANEGGYQALTIAPDSPLAKCIRFHGQAMARLEKKRPILQDLQDFWAPYTADVSGKGRDKPDFVSPDILDDSIFFCKNTLESGLFSGITNPTRIWSEAVVTDPMLKESEAVKDALHELNRRRQTIHSGSNFYDTMRWVYGEWPTFGTAVVLIEEDERDVFRYVPWGIGSYGLMDNARGEAVGLARTFPMTVRQLVERFATRPDRTVNMGRLSLRTRQLVEGNELEREVSVCQLIAPNDRYRPSSDVPRDFAYGSWFWEDGINPTENQHGGLLAEEGYREWPAMVFRWGRVNNDPFGTNQPGLLTLGTNKTLQAMESDLLLAIEKQGKPPLAVPEDRAVSLLPGARNVFTGQSRMMPGPLHTVESAAIERIGAAMDVRRTRMEMIWHTQIMLAFSLDNRPQPKTATEVVEIGQEKFLALGPLLESATRELRRGFDREFGIMERRGLLPDFPPEMEGMSLPLEFTNTLAIALKAVGLVDLEGFGAWSAEFAQMTGDPSVLDKVDTDQLIDEVAARRSLPPRVVRGDEATAKIRKGRAEQAQAQAQADQAAQQAKAIKDVGTTPMGNGSVLDAMVEGGA